MLFFFRPQHESSVEHFQFIFPAVVTEDDALRLQFFGFKYYGMPILIVMNSDLIKAEHVTY